MVSGLRVRDETPSISRRELISISVEVLGSYSIYLFYLGGRGTVRDDNINRNPSCWGSRAIIAPRELLLILSGGIPLSLIFGMYPVYIRYDRPPVRG